MTQFPDYPGLTVRMAEGEDEILAARQLHAACYVEAGYVSKTELRDGVIHDPWVPFSDYYVAIDELDSTAVGTCRAIKPSVAGFPAFQLNDIYPEALEVFRGLDPNLCIECASLATTRDGLQNTAISAGLYRRFWQDAVLGHRAYVLAFLDNRLLRILHRWLKWPWQPIGPEVDYLGSMSTPAALSIPKTIERARRDHPEALAFFSGSIPFSELAQVELDLRDRAPDLATAAIPAGKPWWGFGD